jgi:hypothetical protein
MGYEADNPSHDGVALCLFSLLISGAGKGQMVFG